jgi:pyruvate formate lyase activating enzyme
MANTGEIFKIKKYALHDGPGIRTTVFLTGCPMRCRWCHNPEGLAPLPPAQRAPAADAGFSSRCVSVDDLMAEIEKDTVFYDESGGGVTFSGGEPLLQADFLHRCLQRCAQREIHAAVDTCGYADWRDFEAILDRVDLFLFDLKIIDDARHRRFCGVSNHRVLENLQRLAGAGAPLRIRFPVVPGMTDDPENLRQVSEFVRSLGRVNGVDILPFHRTADGKYLRLGIDNPMAGVPALSRQDVLPVAEQFSARGLSTTVGG